MENKIISQLPVYNSNKHKGISVVDWSKTVNTVIDVIYNNEEKSIYIKEYDKKKHLLKIAIYKENEIYDLWDWNYIHVTNFKKCSFKNLFSIKLSAWLKNNDTSLEIDYDANLNKLSLTYNDIQNLTYSTKTRIYFRCKTCKVTSLISINNLTSKTTSKKTGRCTICSNKIIISDINSLGAKRPDLIKYFKDKTIPNKISYGTHDKYTLVCPVCKKEKDISMDKLTSRGFNCNFCSDKISFPQKIMTSLLEYLNVNYKKEMIFEWSKNVVSKNDRLSGLKRYDFYIKDTNTIIEVHGIQHYKQSFKIERKARQGRSLIEEQENDCLKKSVALINGVNNYIVIDCRESNFNYIKNNILNSEMAILFNLKDVKWEDIFLTCEKSIFPFVCEDNSKGMTVSEISEKYKMSKTAIRKWLYRGNDLGLCRYNIDKLIPSQS